MRNGGRLCRRSFVLIDRTDCLVLELSPSSSWRYSNKFRRPRLRYERRVSHESIEIVWVYGPFLCGMWTDVNIFEEKMVLAFPATKTVVSVGGYRQTPCITENNVTDLDNSFNLQITASHKICIARIKQYNLVGSTIRESVAFA